MPIIAVAVAIGASVAAASAVAAVGLTVVTALEVTAAVGATLAAVGAVTRDKTLTLAGSVIGAIGGIGGLAAGAGLLGADAASNAPLFGPAPSAATADAASADTIGSVTGAAEDLPTPPIPPDVVPPAAADQVAASAAVPEGTALAPQDAATVTGNVQAAQASGTNEVGLSTQTSGNVQELTGLGNTVPSTASTANPSLNPELGGATGFSPGGASESIPPSQGFINDLTGNTITGDPASNALGIKTPADPSTFGKLAAFADAHPTVAFGALQAGSSLLQGLTSTLTPAQVSALQAQAAANDAAAALTNQQRANLAQPKAVATSTPVTGTPAQLVPTQPAGFINQPKLAPVTGVPA